MSTSQIIGAILLAVSALGAGGLKVWTWYKSRPKNFYVPVDDIPTPSVASSTDAPAPPGVAAYLGLVESAAHSAAPQLWWDYAKKGMTEAQVLRAEVKRLTPPEVKP